MGRFFNCSKRKGKGVCNALTAVDNFRDDVTDKNQGAQALVVKGNMEDITNN